MPLRSVGLRAISLKDSNSAVQIDIFEDINASLRDEQIERSIENLRDKYGKNSIKRGRTL